MRFLLAILIVGVLAACNAGASTPTENPLPTLEPTASQAGTDTSTDEMASHSANPSPTAMSCDEAFSQLTSSDISSVSDLTALTDELDDTVANCPSLDDWRTAAEDALPNLDLSGVESFLQARCLDADWLSDTVLCQELAS